MVLAEATKPTLSVSEALQGTSVDELIEEHICSSVENSAEICTADYNPVCGNNGQTYSNGCGACAAGVESWTSGECEQACVGEGESLSAVTANNNDVCCERLVQFIPTGENGEMMIGTRGICVEQQHTKCEDTDGGKDYYEQGKTIEWYEDYERVYVDKCVQDYLDETYCDFNSGEVESISYKCPNGCENGACIQNTVEYVEIGEKFKLSKGEEAVVIDHEKMKIKLNNILNICAESGSVNDKCIKTVDVVVEMDSLSRTEANIGTRFNLNLGESKEIFGVALHFLESDDKSAVFVVEKSTPIEKGYVDVDITPVTNKIHYGEEASYVITITDNHPVVAIMCITAPCPQPEQEIYTYQIKVNNLPFNKEYEKEIKVRAGKSVSTKLIVIPYQLIDEGGVALTGNVVAESVAVSNKPVNKERTVALRKITNTIASQASEQAVVATSTKIAPSFYKSYKFNVDVKLDGNPTIQNSAHAILTLMPRVVPNPDPLTPPDFPTEEETTISLHRGWNLVSLPGKLVKFLSGSDTKFLGFVYLKDEKKYVSIQEAHKILGSKFNEYLAKNAFWIYSYKDTKMKLKIDMKISYSGTELGQGWNLVSITEDMLGGYLSDVSGTCNFEKLYLWNADNQKWEKINEDYQFSDDELYKGFITKITQDCILGGVTVSTADIPAFEEE
ncbi:hypothetical protein HQ529_02395 [Candidatus Woesearchaeota archaeon]|nr:hypothetical protein [Candidatus Woesearchaeota archaeon]